MNMKFKALPDFMIIFSLFSITICPQFLSANIQSPDFEALLAIKAEISGDPDSVLGSWNSSLHYCEWSGITCGRKHRRRVISLYLPSSKLGGTLSPSIGNLSFLNELDLSNNSFQGDIPRQISHLHRLQVLYLGMNLFSGGIPANLSRCLQQISLFENKLVGKIPTALATLPSLSYFDLSENNLSGHLHAIGIGNMSHSLQVLYLSENYLQGSIPDDIGRLKSLETVSLGDNILYGTVPTSLFNLSSLKSLYLSNTKIHGHLPQDLGLRLPQLSYLSFSDTSLSGQVPTSLSNLSKLEYLHFLDNRFTGRFYLDGRNLPQLNHLNIASAFSLEEGEARDMSFLDTLTNCSDLIELFIGGNFLSSGVFPPSILNLSTGLKVLDLGENNISGKIPFGLGKFVNLRTLVLCDNYFSGPIPDDIGSLESIERFCLASNTLSGEIPSSLGNLTRLSLLSMDYNNLQGPLPKVLGNCKNLQTISLSYNKLSGVLPIELFGASSLVELDIGQNNFEGSFPIQIKLLKLLGTLDVSNNMFSGKIPNTLGGCTSLTNLDMSGNSFVGSIPESLSPLRSIKYLDLSCNNFSGQIPSYLSTWPDLLSLNLSFNALEGEVPANGVFANITGVSVIGNNKLCGGVLKLHLPRCSSPRESKRRRLSLRVIVIISIVCVLIIVTLVVALCFCLFCSSRKRKDVPSEPQNVKPFPEVSYQMLSRATNGFSLSNLIGVGAFGSVYKGTLHQDDTEVGIAVKVMNLQNRGASKSFIAECNALKNIRHRNLVKIITVCSSIDTQHNDFKALVYEFVPRGSLDSWLHSNLVGNGEMVADSQSSCLSLFQRLSIAIDVACALEYLHIGCVNQIIHCDLKPANILLDDDMTARVGDFGLAKFLSGASTFVDVNQSTSTQVRGTVGYAAPEYGIGSKASVEGDIYSFGIVVLEMMTSKKPTDPMFSEGLSLHEFAKSAFPDRVMEIIDQRILLGDPNLQRGINGADIRKMDCIKSLIMVGVQCSNELPRDRMRINDAVNELKSMRQNLLCRRT